jgi:hypothetical protein
LNTPLKAPVGTDGKPPPGFPATRGEFEHITSQCSFFPSVWNGPLIAWCDLEERYESILKAYGLPIKGDTDAKREAVRTFVGIPQDGL